MQTFLPYPNFVESAKCLDWRRLGKQRVEALQIHNVLSGKSKSKGWHNHPAVLMWKGHEGALSEYLDCCIREWVSRGYNNAMILTHESGPKPSWFGDPKFHASHRSNLLRKDEIYYSKFGWTERANLPYIWPTQVTAH